MNGIHDLGGMHGFGPLERHEDEPVFKADWERHAHALSFLAVAGGVYNVDEIRHASERIPPERYLQLQYYERWIIGMENMLVAKGVCSAEELKQRWSDLESEVR